MLRFMLLILMCGAAISTAAAQSCSDIRSFDFKNATIITAARDDGSRQEVDSFHFQNGKGFTSDDPDNPQEHDWQLELDSDHLVHPDPSMWLRVIEFDRDHITGTGDWYYVMAFTCRNGHLFRVFQYSSEGVSLKHLDGSNLELYDAVWALNDAHCCPSRHSEIVYQWDAGSHRYHRISMTFGNGCCWMPPKE